jgi:outer membrane protein assembly factor BamA
MASWWIFFITPFKTLKRNLRMNHFYKIFLLFFLFFNISPTSAQQDTIRKIGFSGLPVVASSPETGFIYGIFGQVSFDLYKNNLDSRASQLQLGTTYSVKKQLSFDTDFVLFGREENYSIIGVFGYKNWFGRHYGLGNDASNQIIEHRFDENPTTNTLNYLNYGLDILVAQISYNKKIREGLFVGAILDYYSSNDFSISADSTEIQTHEIIENNMIGQYFGVGFNLIYDTRDNINNPSKGTFVKFSNINYRKWLGGDFEFYTFNLDARKYFNVVKDQTLAMRMLLASTLSDDVIPYTGYQRLGGSELLRGYFDGTYLDKNVIAFEAEYRLPLFQDDSAPIYKIWKHLGVVGFVSAGQVFDSASDFGLSDFRISAGGGLRILLSEKQQTNIRIDYGIGLQENADGIGRKQRGLYIVVNEAF